MYQMFYDVRVHFLVVLVCTLHLLPVIKQYHTHTIVRIYVHGHTHRDTVLAYSQQQIDCKAANIASTNQRLQTMAMLSVRLKKHTLPSNGKANAMINIHTDISMPHITDTAL